MISTESGSLRLFRFAGIQVYLHWTWFVVALIELTTRAGAYESPLWNIAEYLGLFVIVLMHEFGHSLACRQTGGVAGVVNQLGVGPQGLGGDSTSFAVHVETAATHITMNPVAVNIQCHSARRANAIITPGGIAFK